MYLGALREMLTATKAFTPFGLSQIPPASPEKGSVREAPASRQGPTPTGHLDPDRRRDAPVGVCLGPSS